MLLCHLEDWSSLDPWVPYTEVYEVLSGADALVRQPEPQVQWLCQMLLDRSKLSRAGHRPGLCQEAERR